MGIPSYFSNLIKQYPNIIKRLIKDDMKVDNFFLDSNSIVYDCVRNINFEENLSETTYQKIIKNVIAKLEEYIAIVNPCNLIMISLDGTPPVAKLDQQRQRRYKSWYTAKMLSTDTNTNTKTQPSFDTIEITTGTQFMRELNSKLIAHFNNPSHYGVNKIIVSTSDEPGEGESKIYEYIREGNDVACDSVCLVYGLDADLIMLSINNLPVCPNIYLFRETPEFIKSIDSSLIPNENYVMDIPQLTKTILSYMNNDKQHDTDQQCRVYDYIFICFFLGNDFLPHFPAINIRTGGIDKMLNAYKATIGGTKDVLTDGKVIYWKNVRKMVAFLAEREEEYIIAETKLRNKSHHVNYTTDTPEQRFNALPMHERELELYIKPHKSHWQHRYYSALCNLDKDELREKQICTNYLEGLEWTLKYYTSGCPDWRWCYNYNYPPLLTDLIKYIPYFETSYIKTTNTQPVSPVVQLCYVLPKHSLHLLPANVYKRLLEAHPEWYGENYNIIWAYCRYFWESHVQLPEINIHELEQFLRI